MEETAILALIEANNVAIRAELETVLTTLRTELESWQQETNSRITTQLESVWTQMNSMTDRLTELTTTVESQPEPESVNEGAQETPTESVIEVIETPILETESQESKPKRFLF
jgi:predicted nuclease with TOPRIM domain